MIVYQDLGYREGVACELELAVFDDDGVDHLGPSVEQGHEEDFLTFVILGHGAADVAFPIIAGHEEAAEQGHEAEQKNFSHNYFIFTFILS